MAANLRSAEQIVLDEWAKQIRAGRKRLGISQVEAAQRCGITQSTLSKIENADYKLHPAMVLRLCDGLDLDPQVAFGWPTAIVEIQRFRRAADEALASLEVAS